MAPDISLNNVSVTYGSHLALDRVTAIIPHGSVTALIGANGAGKTTLLNALLGLVPYDGTIDIDGRPPRLGRPDIAYVPDVPALPEYLTAHEYLDAMAGGQRGQIAAEIFGFTTAQRIGHYSRGMKQRLAIAGALARRPRFLIADEPTSALDPVTRRDIMEIFSAVSSHTTIIWSTHYLAEITSAASHVITLRNGTLSYAGPPRLAARENRWRLETETPDKLLYAISQAPQLSVIHSSGNDVLVDGDVPSHLPHILTSKTRLTGLHQVQPDLLDIMDGEAHA